MVKLTFTKRNETKGAIRYAEVINGKPADAPNEPGCVIGSLYVRKSAFAGGPIPDGLVVTVTANVPASVG